MRILTIGLGGAGCRIVDRLFVHDRKAPVYCVFGIAVDSDAEQLNSLLHVPAEQRLFFQPLDPSHPGDIAAHMPNEEILSRLQSMDDGDIDAILVCAGLGGTMAGTARELGSYLKKSISEPIFGLCTLPCRKEGNECASLAADQLDGLLEVLDGIILFDNESWKDKAPSLPEDEDPVRSVDFGSLIGRKPDTQPPPSKTEQFYKGMNNLISRRITLLLRAGEFSERETADLPQVVLDAGEILHTIQGMGLISIGYARDEIVRENSLDLLSRIRPGTPSVQDQHLKASRVVELAKKSIFEEMSTPTELEEAKKALILIAGPSHEMSMKGFMTVRRWIDRTISGLELRSGDYPVSGTHFLGIFVILAGMDTLPRVEELRQIRDRRGAEGSGGRMNGHAVDPTENTTIL